ncbi:hypothetical protein [Alicyclobacillus kakegawensis]|uniref:hypothetical protein n=1 Tax=Alicyclobacillus kakegawensis TaxID=392012 RepID=UPI000835A8D5|nr:hypothetical protein [Alicyclobacillus kakegawensis]
MLFPIGRIRWTRAVLAHDDIDTDDLVRAFSRYMQGDWGDLDEAAQLENDLALTNGSPVCAVYTSRQGTRFCICTKDESTIVSLPDERHASGASLQPHAQSRRHYRHDS